MKLRVRVLQKGLNKQPPGNAQSLKLKVKALLHQFSSQNALPDNQDKAQILQESSMNLILLVMAYLLQCLDLEVKILMQ